MYGRKEWEYLNKINILPLTELRDRQNLIKRHIKKIIKKLRLQNVPSRVKVGSFIAP